MNDRVTQTTLMLISHEAPSQSRMSQRKWYPGGVRPKQGWNRRQQSSRSSSSSSSSNRSHPPVNPFNMKLLLLHLCLALHGASEAHEYYDGACPDFPPMGSLDWGRWASGDVWRAALKHNSRSSCIRLGWFSKVGLQSGSHWTFHQWEALTETNGFPVLLCWSSERKKNTI